MDDARNSNVESQAVGKTADPELLRRSVPATAMDLASVKPANSWRTTLTAAGFVSLVAGTLPVATFVHGAVQKSRDIALEHEKQMESARMAYLDRMKDEESRARVLRFIVRTSQDIKMQAWAAEELKLVKDSQDSLLGEIKDLVAKANADANDATTRLAAQAKVSELEVRLGKPSGISLLRAPVLPNSEQSTASQPPSPDAALPATPPRYTGGHVPDVASKCDRWQPPDGLGQSQCRIVCWEAIQKTKYNVRETVTTASAEACGEAALKRCQKAQNNFCAYSWVPPST